MARHSGIARAAPACRDGSDLAKTEGTQETESTMSSAAIHHGTAFSALTRRSLLRRLPGAALACALGPPAAGAATWPAKPVHLVIPFPAGGATDYAARAVGGGLAELWGQAVVFDNRAGAGSTLGTQIGAKSAPDGYTLVMGVPAGISIAPHIYPKLGYDPLSDLLPIAGFAQSPMVVVVPADSPYRTLAELVAAARARPDGLAYASNGSGSLPHLATEWFLTQTRTRMVHVPYRGSALALPDLIAGRTQLMIDIIVSALPLIEAGKLRALAVTGTQRSGLLPQVPTAVQCGFPGFAVTQWYGLFAPAGTPAAILAQVERNVKTVTDSTRLRGLMWQRGAEVDYRSAAPFAAAVKADWQRWKAVALATGARAE
jgi:tripartite-type tricarboxylate transporter receptor subunit TctC